MKPNAALYRNVKNNQQQSQAVGFTERTFTATDMINL
jgi:hypothetical protein